MIRVLSALLIAVYGVQAVAWVALFDVAGLAAGAAYAGVAAVLYVLRPLPARVLRRSNVPGREREFYAVPVAGDLDWPPYGRALLIAAALFAPIVPPQVLDLIA